MKTYHGRCACNAIRFEADIDLAAATGHCTCGSCRGRSWNVRVGPEAFRLLAGAEALADVRVGKAGHHLFCRHCGIRPFGRGHGTAIGDYVSINLTRLDDVPADELVAPLYDAGRRDLPVARRRSGTLLQAVASPFARMIYRSVGVGRSKPPSLAREPQYV